LAGEEAPKIWEEYLVFDKMDLRNSLPLRTLFIDHYVENELKNEEIKQVVVLGCGMDSRPYRLQIPSHLHWFEVDMPHVLEYKHNILSRLKEAVPKCHIHTVAIDLCDPEWPKQLQDATFSPSEPSLWILEGLIGYLTESDVHKLLDNVASLSTKGSKIVLTSPNKTFLEISRDTLPTTSPFFALHKYSTDQPDLLLTSRGYANTELHTIRSIAEKFGHSNRIREGAATTNFFATGTRNS